MTDTVIDPTLPDTVKNFLASGAKLEHIRLDKHGQWWHRGLRFENAKIAALFSRSVARTKGGTWILNIGRFIYPIDVEDTGVFVVKWSLTDDDEVTLHLSDNSKELLNASTLRYDPEGGLVCLTQDKGPARFLKTPYYELAEFFVEDNEDFLLNIGTISAIVRARETAPPSLG